MEQFDRVTEYLKSKNCSQSGYFDYVDSIYVYLGVFGLGFELTTDQGAILITEPNEEQQRMLYGLLAKLEISRKRVEVMGGVNNGMIEYLAY